MRVMLVTPPMAIPNTPYPATCHLMGFLQLHQARLGLTVSQVDLSLELILSVLTRPSLQAIFERTRAAVAAGAKLDEATRRHVDEVLAQGAHYLNCIEPTVAFLQGKDPTLANRIAGRRWLPEGASFEALRVESSGPEGTDGEDDAPTLLGFSFGTLGIHDQAAHLATLFVTDVVKVIAAVECPQFTLTDYAESLSTGSLSFDLLAAALAAPTNLVDAQLDRLTERLVAAEKPNLVCVTAPFPGNVYGAFRVAQQLRRSCPQAKVALGGGFVNTELRSLAEPRVFDFFDYVTLDGGERPLLSLLERLAGTSPAPPALFRTFVREGQTVAFHTDPRQHDIPHRDTGTPSSQGLNPDRYLSTFPVLNPMQRLWSDGYWNKLMVAHGCYWKKCSFCDVSLDYIGRYDPVSADLTVDRMAAMVKQTGRTGFHFVDEAAPPAGLRGLSEKLLERGLAVSWWGNIRFDKAFTPELAQLMADAGCIGVSGGLEVASDRLLKLINKGVTVDQVARVTRALTDAGILVHAYLMYGFPSQTVQDTIDSFELVRQLFDEGCLQSGFWHRFNATVHSPVGQAPQQYGIELMDSPSVFRNYAVGFTEQGGIDHSMFTQALNTATYRFMQGLGTGEDVRSWFDDELAARLPAPQVAPDAIRRALG